MRWRRPSEVLRSRLSTRFSARETVIFDTPTRAATSAMVTARAGPGAAGGDFLRAVLIADTIPIPRSRAARVTAGVGMGAF